MSSVVDHNAIADPRLRRELHAAKAANERDERVDSAAGIHVVITTLEDIVTPAERRMAEMGEHQRLRDSRMFFQYAAEGEFIGAVEQVTGRKVRAFVSGIDSGHDASSEAFYLEPRI